MSEYENLKRGEKELLKSIYNGEDLVRSVRKFATKTYQEGFKQGILESSDSWWSQMDQDQPYIDSVSKTDEADNAREWEPL